MLVMILGDRLMFSSYRLSDFSPVELPLCWGSHVLARLARPKYETTSNHFQTLGSSPPVSKEGSLYDCQRSMSLKLKVKVFG